MSQQNNFARALPDAFLCYQSINKRGVMQRLIAFSNQFVSLFNSIRFWTCSSNFATRFGILDRTCPKMIDFGPYWVWSGPFWSQNQRCTMFSPTTYQSDLRFVWIQSFMETQNMHSVTGPYIMKCLTLLKSKIPCPLQQKQGNNSNTSLMASRRLLQDARCCCGISMVNEVHGKSAKT